MLMLTVAQWLSTAALRAHAATGANPEFQACACFSLLGLVMSLAFLHLDGPDAFVLLAGAN